MMNEKPRKQIPNYVADKLESIMLARRIENFYHKKGFIQVKCWVECVNTFNGQKRWEVKSNLKFNVKSIA